MIIDLKSAPRQESRLTAISVAGFKSIVREQTLHIAPLTILAGANSSGKSSMMQPLLLMKQTLEAPYDPGTFLLDGPNVRFTSSKQILSISPNNEKTVSFSTSFTINTNRIKFTYKQNSDYSFDIENSVYSNNKSEACFTTSMNSADFIAEISKLNPRKKIETKTIEEMYNVNQRCFHKILAFSKNKNRLHSISPAKDTIRPSQIADILISMIHITGLRGNPERTYKTSGVVNKFPGTFENYSASIIYYWDKNNKKNLHTLNEHIAFIGLTSKVSATSLDATQVEIKVGRLPTSNANDTADLVNIADVGVGVSQTLPVLVALLAAEPGQIVYIEQPEIHLHPLAQYKLAAVIAEASKRGVLVIIETHSDILIRGVQTLVAKGELDPTIVKLHWFSRSPEDGSTTVTCAELDENGAFGDWPQDFDTTALDTEKAYLDAVEARIATHEK